MDTLSIRTTEEVAAGDPFLAAAERKHQKGCSYCFGGYVSISVEEVGAEHDEPFPCHHCHSKERR